MAQCGIALPASLLVAAQEQAGGHESGFPAGAPRYLARQIADLPRDDCLFGAMRLQDPVDLVFDLVQISRPAAQADAPAKRIWLMYRSSAVAALDLAAVILHCHSFHSRKVPGDRIVVNDLKEKLDV